VVSELRDGNRVLSRKMIRVILVREASGRYPCSIDQPGFGKRLGLKLLWAARPLQGVAFGGGCGVQESYSV
jgi:hypothetical protein